jgi:hypothetical protein
MNGFFYGFADVCNALFSILPSIGELTNGLFLALGSIATAIWIWYMVKFQNEEKGFNQ